MKRNQTLGIVAAIGIIAVAVYGIVARQGNVEAEDSCTINAQLIETELAPLATGEVAAFQTPREAQDLSGLAFVNSAGAETSIGDFSGKVLLVNVWATWCAPCRREMPALDRLQSELGGEKFEVVPINIDTGSADKPQAFLESIGVKNLPLHRDPTTDVFQTIRKRGLGIGLPVTLLLDKSGCQLGHMAGPAEWDSDDAKALIRAALGE
jgi:thiol-disulfide isomerase/thioredoxin